ncbi:hypothetical protein GLOIN_2v1776594 [Rhizophagus irregularis DAOM 181602=DAOM 197198]|nr:hypothetical protein GLOIN_2v1776594 [Rhizophagus irregularis DAOM 181602=DAOM 197198]
MSEIGVYALCQRGVEISAFRVLWDSGFRLPGSLGYWISASRVLWDIGFRLPGFFGILDFGFPSSFGYWIERISGELSGQSGQTSDTRIEWISIDPSGQSSDTTKSI